MEIDEKLPFLQEKGNKEKQCRERLTNCKRPQKVSKYKCELPNSILTLCWFVLAVQDKMWDQWLKFSGRIVLGQFLIEAWAKVPKLDFQLKVASNYFDVVFVKRNSYLFRKEKRIQM